MEAIALPIALLLTALLAGSTAASPRVIIVGAGLSGRSSVNQLYHCHVPLRFYHRTLLELDMHEL